MSQSTLQETTALAFQEQMIALVRAFGLHRPDETPCGKPVPVAEAHALMELARAQPLSQNDLVDRLRLAKSSVSRLVDLLEARGWVERRRDPRDGRAVRLWLTAGGQQAATELATARRVKFAHLLERIPEQERETVLRALATLVEALHGL